MAEENKNPSRQTQNKSKIAEREEEILKFWQENNIFSKTLSQSKGEKEFIFYEGPPTANGKPGIHHLEARAYKDVIPRFKTMKGFHVRRKGGWDTHGLPVELQVEKELGLKTKKEIEEYGVAQFNKRCKESVWEYLDVWEKFTDRIGFWVDQKDPYITYENYYIEAVWSILKKINERKLLYKDYKVVPWCPRCGTGLSSHELAQGYEDVKETSVTIEFKLKKFPDTSILAWTTTPWTLPGNVALAVGEKIDYVEIEKKDEGIGKLVKFILAKDRLKAVFSDSEFKIVKEMRGKDLVGLEYEPLYPYAEKFASGAEKEKMKNAFKVYPADFVTTEDGTGVVHTAVMYGQEDFVLGNEIGLPKIHVVNDDGTFKQDMGFMSGRFVKEQDEKGRPTLAIEIIEDLKKRGLYFSDEPYKHSYPFCWRCKTPLIYYARDSWYVKMSDLRKELVKENEDINWVPAHIKEGRFGEWLKEVKDWAISRERYWGTPLPIWQNQKGENTIIGSLEDLKKHIKKSGNKYFVMRHGEAEQNLNDAINADIKNVFHLTEEGKRQVTIAAEDLKSQKIDLIISSPFERCKETAKIVASSVGLDENEIIFDEKIGELQTGPAYEGKTWKEYINFFENLDDRFKMTPEGGETLTQVNRRVGEFLYDLEKKYTGKNILIVSHGAQIIALKSLAKGADLKEAKSIRKAGNEFNTAEFEEFDFCPLPHDENYFLDLHKPFIDEIELVDKNGEALMRVKEVMDVWFDSGGMPFAQDGLLGQKNMKYPADFISEAVDQTRGWFYTLHAIGVLMGKGRAFKNVICLGHVLDAKGKKMSKSLGNIVDPWLMIEKYGADALRLWMYTVNQPGDSKNFDEKTVDEVVKKVFNLAENVLSFYDLYREDNIQPSNKNKNILDQWIVAKIYELTNEGEKCLDEFKVFEAARMIRDFVNDLSTWYIRRSRDRFKSEDLEDKKAALSTTRFVLLELAKYMAPFTPFFAEYIYLKLKGENDPESVHLCDWSKTGKIDEEILKNMEAVRKIVSLALEKRMAAGIKVRQPLSKLVIRDSKLENKKEYLELIKDEVNVKEVIFDEKLETEVELDTEITPELQKEGNVRDFIRAVQELRKEKKLLPSDEAELWVEAGEAGRAFLESAAIEIKKPTNISEFKFEKNDGAELKIENMVFKIYLNHNS